MEQIQDQNLKHFVIVTAVKFPMMQPTLFGITHKRYRIGTGVLISQPQARVSGSYGPFQSDLLQMLKDSSNVARIRSNESVLTHDQVPDLA